tara:strand:- start:73 stop:741 length:669 start_codon:yes stop_codon:yes gene_type:complete
MATQRHPVDSFKKELNFWEEFPDFKIHPTFSRIWKANKDHIDKSSLFMWALALCYDRKSSFYPQPEADKWEAVSWDLFNDENALMNFALYDDENKKDPFEKADTDETVAPVIGIPKDLTFRGIILDFEKAIDIPLGIALRELERKLVERTKFIMETTYSLDYYDDKGKLKKGTSDQLDRMFTNTDKINALITKAMADLYSIDGSGTVKGGQKEGLGDAGKDF